MLKSVLRFLVAAAAVAGADWLLVNFIFKGPSGGGFIERKPDSFGLDDIVEYSTYAFAALMGWHLGGKFTGGA